MKKFFALCLALVMILSLAACGKKDEPDPVPSPEPTPAPVEVSAEPTATPEPTPEPTPVPLQPELPEVHDESLNAILDSITADVQPGSAGSSLRAAQCAAKLLDWGINTPLNDDEIYSAVGCWLDVQDSDSLVMFFDGFYGVYTAVYNLKGENAEALLSDAGVTGSAHPWNEQAFHAVEMVCYGCGVR